MSTTVVVPCFNEAQRIELERFLEFPRQGVDVLFVDDGSTDDTRARLQRFVATNPGHLAVLGLDRNGGKGEAVRRGLQEAMAKGATVVGYLDADLATPPAEMLRVLEALRDGAAVALGSRVSLLGRHIDRRPLRHYLGRVFATGASLALGLRVYDTQCGAKAFAVTDALRNALATPFDSRWVFDVELLARLVHPASGLAVPVEALVEVPLHEWHDVRGSKLGPTAMARAAADLAAVAWRRRRGGSGR